jgi:hypothetical protein
MPTIKLTDPDEIEDLFWEGDRFAPIKMDCVRHGRWYATKIVIVEERKTGKFYRYSRDEPLTESQEREEVDEVVLTEVRAVERKAIIYEAA